MNCKEFRNSSAEQIGKEESYLLSHSANGISAGLVLIQSMKRFLDKNVVVVKGKNKGVKGVCFWVGLSKFGYVPSAVVGIKSEGSAIFVNSSDCKGN